MRHACASQCSQIQTNREHGIRWLGIEQRVFSCLACPLLARPAAHLVSASSSSFPSWLARSGLPLPIRGFLPPTVYRQSKRHSRRYDAARHREGRKEGRKLGQREKRKIDRQERERTNERASSAMLASSQTGRLARHQGWKKAPAAPPID